MMASARERLIWVLAAAICSVGCSSPPSNSEFDDRVDRIEIYYRDFDTLSPIHYSADELIKSATLKTVATNREAIEGLQELTALNCVVDQEVSKDQIDVYLLMRKYRNGKLVSTWGASRFHFYERPGDGYPCKLEPTNREALKDALARVIDEVG